MTTPGTLADLYLRLSDPRNEQALDGREDKLRAEAARLGWDVHRVITENDLSPGANGDGRIRGASAFKRQKIRLPNGQVALRTVRPGFRSMLDDLTAGIVTAILAEDLDRLLRQPRDGEDLLDAVELSGATARSLSGSLTLTSGGNDTERMVARISAAVASKSSADTSRRIKDSRQRHAGQSWNGGRRLYGYRADPGSERYHRTLLIVENEAEVIRRAAGDILDRDVSLRAIIRSLNGAGVPTARGGTWTSATLRSVLTKPANAGLTTNPAVSGYIDAPWPPILPRDRWEQLRDKFADPGRRTTTRGPEPRWLVSCIARCPCGSPVSVFGASRDRAPVYRCTNLGGPGHVSRVAYRVDELVTARIIWRLSQPDADTLLLPPVVPGAVDGAALRAELKALRARRKEQMDMHAHGEVTRADLTVGLREIRDLMQAIEARLAVASKADPLAEFRGRPADVVWDTLGIARKRAVVRLLADVTFMPAPWPGPKFNPAGVRVEWKA